MAESPNTAICLVTDAQVSASPEKSIGTKGLLKTILQKGNSWQTPIPGDEVEVHYSVRLQDGEYFDSSRNKGTPFVFKLGQCEVIKGCDEGISTMRKGERAVFTIPPDLAYGEAGSPPMVPPNSTLIFDVELISWNPIRDITGDGGILKKITREGDGWATPNDADEVLVKYEARCEKGTVISKSDGLEFSLNNGYLCSAMSKAVKTMRKGEKAELSVKFSYGLRHSEDGISTIDGVPPYSNLIINLELISWRSVIDVMGDEKILKKVMKLGKGFDRPSEGSLAKVIYVGKLEDGTVISRKGSEEEPFEYTCSEGKIEEGLDKAVMTMKKGEEAIVKISSDFYYGCEVGRNSSDSVLYEIKLVDFTKDKPFWKMEIQERMEACERKKHEGNILFKAEKFQLASKKYDKECDLRKYSNTEQNIEYIEYNHSFSAEEKLQANSLRISCYLNNAACKLKLEEYLEVSRLCTKVLELDSFNVKALFRRSQAYMSTSDLEKAEDDLKRALAVDPKNKDLKLKHKDLKEKQRQYFQEEAKIFSTMISRTR
ncbi:70 kDa peptidyl-prolyl isomerase-like [Olea europaea subsp. europaea]|uniref:peptidylprolyl isomerase n=1 Tax=Olea europaea subsp. europaea TaxID=158383 RepID=A0A8S0PCK1_OLEEU|nr:70 kDa peptidyl-prolyl isomerase-like [Olea europaea subsp. europaea]